MATYVIGDIQGCYRTLQRLLARCGYSERRDRIWLVGDFVNRGPRSLQVLRWAADQGDRLKTVLGNHDVHLLRRSEGLVPPRRGDTLEPILDAADREELLAWLRRRPFIHREASWLLVHAGLLPRWTVGDAVSVARGAEELLRGPSGRLFLQALDGGRPRPREKGAVPRAASFASILTRIRVCDRSGRPLGGFSGPPEEAPAGAVPWFDVPGRRSARTTVLFGHWAALGLRATRRIVALDSGCVWGGALTAFRLEDRAIFQAPFSD